MTQLRSVRMQNKKLLGERLDIKVLGSAIRSYSNSTTRYYQTLSLLYRISRPEDIALVKHSGTVFLAQLTTQSNHWVMLNLLSILLGQADGTHLTHKPTNSGCLFLQLLNLDSRFQVYKHFVPNPQAVQVINICQPEDSGKGSYCTFEHKSWDPPWGSPLVLPEHVLADAAGTKG